MTLWVSSTFAWKILESFKEITSKCAWHSSSLAQFLRLAFTRHAHVWTLACSPSIFLCTKNIITNQLVHDFTLFMSTLYSPDITVRSHVTEWTAFLLLVLIMGNLVMLGNVSGFCKGICLRSKCFYWIKECKMYCRSRLHLILKVYLMQSCWCKQVVIFLVSSQKRKVDKVDRITDLQ